jgi:hypothetical protein
MLNANDDLKAVRKKESSKCGSTPSISKMV